MFALMLWAWQAAWTQRVGAPTGDLESVSVDELFSLQVTSVGRKAQELSKAPAAIFVLTAEDIRRTGATCIPEALQWVPGLTVLHLDGRSWVVSARGGARLYADKILVMIDGRSLYTPLFSGVIWDSIDVPMEDIEQIEVVRGPGAVMWGPNAVNGVINVITRRAKATKGGQVSVATGNEVRNSTEARWGAAPSDAVAYRVWGKFDYRTPAFDSPGYFRFNNRYNYRDPDIRNLDAGAARVGFRLEGQSGEKDQWMVQAEGYQMDRQDPMAYPVIVPTVIARSQGHTDYEGGDVQAKWTHTASVGNESELQFTYSRNDLNYPFLAGQVNNLTLDYQHRSQAGEHNELYWGAGYQQYWDRTQSGTAMGFSPLNYTFRSGDVVVRDEWQFVPGRLDGFGRGTDRLQLLPQSRIPAQFPAALHPDVEPVGVGRRVSRGAGAQPVRPRCGGQLWHVGYRSGAGVDLSDGGPGVSLGSGAEPGGGLSTAIGPAMVRGCLDILELLRAAAPAGHAGDADQDSPWSRADCSLGFDH